MSSSSSSDSSFLASSFLASGLAAAPPPAAGAAAAAAATNFDGSLRYSLAISASLKVMSVSRATAMRFLSPFTMECGAEATVG
uniref:Uncharacterized protein n=1 Tax=Ixodes ricinus TaxID=34613 RepID=A0A6B0U788_IXORI